MAHDYVGRPRVRPTPVVRQKIFSQRQHLHRALRAAQRKGDRRQTARIMHALGQLNKLAADSATPAGSDGRTSLSGDLGLGDAGAMQERLQAKGTVKWRPEPVELAADDRDKVVGPIKWMRPKGRG